MSPYDSESSTLVNQEHAHRRRRSSARRSSSTNRYDSTQPQADPRQDRRTFGDFDQNRSKYVKIGGAVVVVGIVGVLLHKYQKQKKEQKERERRNRRSKDFERAKRERRRDEERREREDELDGSKSPPLVMRRIEYKPERTRSRSRSRSRSTSSSGSYRRPQPSKRYEDDMRYDGDRRPRSRAH